MKSNTHNPLVSVIIPVYNVEQYVCECVDNIISQTYSNIEILLIDDGSTDRSGAICDEYKQRDNRIIVIHQNNQGLSCARNTGIDNAKGDFLVFVDSDDIPSTTMIKRMVDLSQEYNSSFVSCFFTCDQKDFFLDKKEHIEVLSPLDALMQIFSEKTFQTSACAKMYAKSLWNDIRFPKGKLFEDYATIYKVVLVCGSVVSTDKPYYFYRPNPNGITGSFFNKRKLDYFDITNEIYEELKKRNLKKHISALKNRTERYAISFYKDISRSNYNDKEVQRFLVKIIRSNILKYCLTKYRFKSKVYGLLIAIFPNLALKLFR